MQNIFRHSCVLLVLAALVSGGGAQAQIVPSGVSYVEATYNTLGPSDSVWLGNIRPSPGTWRDIVIANRTNDSVTVMLCRDDGTFANGVQYAVGLNPVCVRNGDFNRDLADDIVVANKGTNTISVLINWGSGAVFDPATNYVVGTGANPDPISVAVADVNKDNRLDILCANQAENSVSLLTNKPGTTFGGLTHFPLGASPRTLWMAALDTNSMSDILTANTDSTLTILYGTNTVGGGHTNYFFTAPVSINMAAYIPGVDVRDAKTGDFNGDGRMDICTANYNNSSVSILLRQADGSYSHNGAVGTGLGTAPKNLYVRDMNYDGILDIVVVDAGLDQILVLTGDGNAGFSIGGSANVQAAPEAVVSSNFNWLTDRLSDMAIVYSGTNVVSVLQYAEPISYDGISYGLEDQALNNIVLQYSALAGPSTVVIHNFYTNGVWLTDDGYLTNVAPNRYTFVPNGDWNGTNEFDYHVESGALSSGTATIKLVIRPVNDQPSFNLATNLVALRSFASNQVEVNIAENMSVGPGNEAGQSWSFLVSNTCRTAFSMQPTISPSGTLTFKPSTTANNTNVTVRVWMQDNGGLASGGINASAMATFTIQIPTNTFKYVFKGTYNGLFHENDEVRHKSSGFISFTVADLGTYSGKIVLGATHSFTGSFRTDGVAEKTILRTGQNPLYLTLQLNVSGYDDNATGTVSDGVWTASLQADRARFHATTNACPKAGQYTLLIPANDCTDTNVPGGDGYAKVSVSAAGSIVMSGYLSDGTIMSQTAPMSQDYVWPLYVPLLSGKGSLLSWVTFTNDTFSSFIGAASWIKTNSGGLTRYTRGFTNDVFVIGSTYTNPAAGVRVLDLTNGMAVLCGGNMNSNLNMGLTLNVNHTVTVTNNTRNLTITLTPLTNGLFSGSFKHPVSGVLTPIKGAVFQQNKSAAGYFLGSTRSGGFLLQGN